MPIQYSFLTKSRRLPISRPSSSVRRRGAERPGSVGPGLGLIRVGPVGKIRGRRAPFGVARIEPVSPVADQELGLVRQRRAADPDEHPVRALQVRNDPTVQPPDDLVRDLDMPRGHPAVERES